VSVTTATARDDVVGESLSTDARLDYRRGMRLFIAGVSLLVLAACGSSGSAASADAIDRDAWRAELMRLDDVSSSPDLDTLERVTRDTCEEDVDQVALELSLSGARPDVTRVNMKYVCPGEVDKVDEALEQIQDASSAVDEACATDPLMRTEKQSQLAEAMGCDS
jgi:hypothetical protein